VTNKKNVRPSQEAILRWCKARVNINACLAVLKGNNANAIRKAFLAEKTSQGLQYWRPIYKGDREMDAAARGRIREAIKVQTWIEAGCYG